MQLEPKRRHVNVVHDEELVVEPLNTGLEFSILIQQHASLCPEGWVCECNADYVCFGKLGIVNDQL
jgi:hypothetical protein